MTAESSIVFSLEIRPYDSDAEEDAGKEVVIWTPCLTLYRSSVEATALNEGLSIVEGGLWFFAADGSPMEAEFFEQPFINSEKNTYFAGVYKLVRGHSDRLQSRLSDIIAGNESPHTRIIVYVPATDAYAKDSGWRDMHAMTEAVSSSLGILSPDLMKRVKFDLIRRS